MKCPSDGGFREVKNVKIYFLSHNFMANIGGINKRFDIFIISGISAHR